MEGREIEAEEHADAAELRDQGDLLQSKQSVDIGDIVGGETLETSVTEVLFRHRQLLEGWYLE